jgi:hypothetical protein
VFLPGIHPIGLHAQTTFTVNGIQTHAQDNRVEGNYIGTNAAGEDDSNDGGSVSKRYCSPSPSRGLGAEESMKEKCHE